MTVHVPEIKDMKPMHWTRANPGVGEGPIPVERYVSDAYFQKEKEAVFEKAWLHAARESQIPNAGDYVVRDIPIANASILILRRKDGGISAFHNVCPHRGNQLAWENKGKCKGFIACRFHGWTFNEDGKMIYVSDEQNFPSVSKETVGLKKVHVDTWQGFIFISLAETPKTTLAEFMAPITENVDGYPLAEYEHAFQYRVEENVNWKTAMEAQLEGWHLPYLHPNTLAVAVQGAAEKNYRHASIERLGIHGLLSSRAPDSFSPSPVGKISMQFGASTMDSFAKKRDGASNGSSDGKGPKWRGAFDFYHLFPNTMLGLLEGTYILFNFWPVAPNRTIWEINGFYPPVKDAGQLFSREYSKVSLREPMAEDSFTHEKVGPGLQSGALEEIHLQDEEMALRHLGNTVDAAVRGDLQL